MQLDFAKLDGLLPAIVQDAKTKDVLMLGFMNEEAYEHTMRTGKVTFWSRTRQKLWTKGETSGNFLYVRRVHRGLRRRHPADRGRPGRTGLPHRRRQLLLQRDPGRRIRPSEVRRAEYCAAQGQSRSPDTQAVRGGRPASPTRRRQRLQRDHPRPADRARQDPPPAGDPDLRRAGLTSTSASPGRTGSSRTTLTSST